MKFGILGYGSIGRRHADNLEALGHEVVVYDPLLNDLKGACTKDKVLAADAVLICTPTEQHFTDLRDVPSDKPVFVEKPIATPDRIPELKEILAKRTAPAMVGCNLRFHPGVVAAKRWLSAQEIGDIVIATFHVSQPCQRKYLSDGVLLNSGAHEIDLALYLLGSPDWVNACIANEDYAFVILKQQGAPTNVHLDWLVQPFTSSVRKARIVGKKGDILIDLIARKAELQRGNGVLAIGAFNDINSDYMAEMQAFIAAIEGRSLLPGATGADGVKTLEVIETARVMAG